MAVFKDKLFEAQWLRAAGHASYGAAEIAECLEVARQIGGAEPERWFEAWSGFASRLFEAAERSEHAGRAASARGAYLRASNYWRAAWTFLFQAPIDERALHAYRRHREAFIRAAKLMTPAGEAIRIPYEGKLLHGYFFKAGDDGAPRKTLIINGGYDSTAEEAFLFSGAAALERAFNAFVFDGPGQGAAIFEDGLMFRPDWEKVIGPVVDYLFTRPEVDRTRVALMGISFGGYLAPRAASFERRLAALIADPGAALAIRRDEAALTAFRRSPANGSRGGCSAHSRIRPLPPPSPRLAGLGAEAWPARAWAQDADRLPEIDR